MNIRLITCIAALVASLNVAAQSLTPEQLDTCRVFNDLGEAIVQADQVYVLDLTRQRLKEFPQEVFLMRNLNTLVLDRNKLDSIPNRIQDLHHLQILSVERNNLETLPDGICALDSLRQLRLGDNEIARIPENIGQLQALEVLSLWSNVVGYYPESLSELKRLKELDLLNVQMNQEEQDFVRYLLPEATITFSPPCDCEFEDPWDVPETDE